MSREIQQFKWIIVITTVNQDDTFRQTILRFTDKRKPDIFNGNFAEHIRQCSSPRLTFVTYLNQVTKKVECVTFSERLLKA